MPEGRWLTAAEAAEEMEMTPKSFASFLLRARERGHTIGFVRLIDGDEVQKAAASMPGRGRPGVAKMGRMG